MHFSSISATALTLLAAASASASAAAAEKRSATNIVVYGGELEGSGRNHHVAWRSGQDPCTKHVLIAKRSESRCGRRFELDGQKGLSIEGCGSGQEWLHVNGQRFRPCRPTPQPLAIICGVWRLSILWECGVWD